MANDLRIGGLASGMDTQGTIDKIMKYSKAPLDRLKQSQQKLLWQQDAYRTQNTSLTNFQNTVFNLKLETNYNLKKVNSSNQQVASATADPNAANGSYNLTVNKLATVATNTSSSAVSVRSSMLSNYIALSASKPVVIDDTNHQFTVKLDDGTAQTITLTNQTYDGTTGKTLSDLAQDIQTQLNKSFTTTPVYVRATDDKELQFYTGQKADGKAHTLVMGAVFGDTTLTSLGLKDQDTTKALVGNILTAPIAIDSSNNKFKITVGNGSATEITLDNGNYSLADMATAIQTKLTTAGGDLANVKVTATNYNQLQFTPTNSGGTPPSLKLESGSSNDVLSKLGFTSGTLSNYPKNTIDVTAGIWNQKDKFMNNAFFTGKDQSSSFSFAINGQAFNFNTSNTLNDIINAINANGTAGVTATYDNFTDKLTLATKKFGNNNESGQEIQVSDPNGFLNGLFNINQANEVGGENAQLNINGVDTQKTDNNFKMNGVSFSLTGLGSTIVNVSTDTSGVGDQIQKFVDSYNDLIKGLNDKVTEKRPTNGNSYTYYEPLTDDQKKAMSADEITAWNKTAQQGLLHNSSILNGALSEMRMGLSRIVDTPLSVKGMGLSGTVDLKGSNRISVTVGSQTREIVLDEKSYTSSNYNQLAADIQSKMNLAFGTNTVQVGMNGNSLTFTTQNIGMTFNNGSQSNGLNVLGLSNGATVKTSYDRLEQIGITTSSDWTQNGKLSFDKNKFETALAANPDGVMRLLTGNGVTDSGAVSENQKGVFYQLYDVTKKQVKNITDEVGTSGTTNTSAVGKQLTDIGKSIDSLQDKLNEEQDRLWTQFSALETAMQNYNSQSSWLAQQLGMSSSSS